MPPRVRTVSVRTPGTDWSGKGGGLGTGEPGKERPGNGG